ncbi:MAG: B12-binding domain-containing radical SAM protein [Nanoarchaeota archaeon]|nr:B12-binding domain-containing radical SAM protein [Nanoarchaeota archaeon]
MRIALIQPRFEYVMPYHITPLSLGILATLSNCDVDVIDTNFTKIKMFDYDLVGISCTSFTATSAYKIADMFRDKGVKVVLGGVHPTFCAAEALKHADSVVVGEAEGVWKKVIEDFRQGKLGKMYDGGYADMSRMPIVKLKYRQKRKSILYSIPLLIQTSRGCVYDCDFCSVTKFSGRKIRHRPVEDVVKEIKLNKAKSVFFVDDNLVADFGYAEKLFKALIPLKIKWGGQVPLNFARNDKFVRLAKKSGCRRLFVGIESVNQESINEVSDKCKVSLYEKQIKILRDNNIIVWAGFIFGFDHDNKKIFSDTLKFCFRNKIDMVNFHPLAAFPGTRLYEDKELVKDYLVKPKNMSIDELLGGINWAYRQFYSWPKILQRTIWQLKRDWYKPVKLLKFIYLSRGYYKSAVKA